MWGAEKECSGREGWGGGLEGVERNRDAEGVLSAGGVEWRDGSNLKNWLNI